MDAPQIGVKVNDAVSDIQQNGTITFTDMQPGYESRIDSQPDDTQYVGATDDVALSDFLSRPQRILDYTWEVGPSIDKTFNPWLLFFSNPRVKNRIANFNLLRCTMRIKFLINGNGFYFGRMMCSYLQRPEINFAFRGVSPVVFDPASGTHTNWEYTSGNDLDVMPLSQLLRVFLNPTTSMGSELHLPFFFEKNFLSIPDEEWDQMGIVHMKSLSNLRHANGSSDPISVSVMAWCEDVVLSIPTSQNPATLVAQGDEYTSSPVSTTASAVADIANLGAKVPVIGPYARATAIAADSISSVAKFFGFSRPVNLKDIETYKPWITGDNATTNSTDSAMKLSLDCKQELTIDPRTVGLSGADELAILPIVQRESWYCDVTWATDDPAGDAIWSSYVTPSLYERRLQSDVASAIYMTPSCWIANLFEYWSGSIEFRFMVQTSAYHKGRLRVVWDPRFLSDVEEFNVNYSHIIDLAETNDFSVRVGWGNDRNFCRCLDINVNRTVPSLNRVGRTYTPDPVPLEQIEGVDTTFAGSGDTAMSNGVLSLQVLNELTTPNSTVNNNVKIQIFARMCDDARFFGPTTANLDAFSWAEPNAACRNQGTYLAQSGPGKKAGEIKDIYPTSHDAYNTDREAAPYLDSADLKVLGPPLPTSGPLMHVFGGEAVTSLRAMLKRYCVSRVISREYSGSDTGIGTKFNLSLIPPHRGNLGIPGTFDSNRASYSFTRNTLLNYIFPVYTGWRGSIRWKWILHDQHSNNPNTQNNTSLFITRSPNRPIETVGQIFPSDQLRSASGRAGLVNSVPHGWSGSQMTESRINPVLHVEFPFYSNDRFKPTGFPDFYGPFSATDHQSLTIIPGSRNNGDTDLLYGHVSVGEDFNTFYFTGIPPIYRYSDPTPA